MIFPFLFTTIFAVSHRSAPTLRPRGLVPGYENPAVPDHDFTVPDDHVYIGQILKIFVRSAGDHNHIRKLARLQGPQLVAHIQDFSIGFGGCNQSATRLVPIPIFTPASRSFRSISRLASLEKMRLSSFKWIPPCQECHTRRFVLAP